MTFRNAGAAWSEDDAPAMAAISPSAMPAMPALADARSPTWGMPLRQRLLSGRQTVMEARYRRFSGGFRCRPARNRRLTGAARGEDTPARRVEFPILLAQLTGGGIGYGSQGTVSLCGNPNLEPETSTNFEASALYRAGEALSAQATLFRSELKNLIEAGTGANAGQSLNIGEAVLQGIELASIIRLNDRLTLSDNYTYIDSEATQTQLDTGHPAQLIASKKAIRSSAFRSICSTLRWTGSSHCASVPS